ncbi:hypothetical protein FGADI_5885 [Fusarium gaditjirri]|uniref:DUF6604 domain-containing protein n=1 Tax=Fusarium gaditjirri TaxID=282569 RepID=A0A8H4T963_9HYPO|nr:hypothetical protein FGADI_5885 [Fusarium gaditjirri]
MLPPALVSVYPKKKAKAAPNKPAPQKEGPRYIIEIKHFVPLTESISNYKKPALAIPQAFFSTLNRVISVRNGFSEQLLRHNEKPDIKSDARHSYFAGILEEVRDILKPFSDSAASSSTDIVDRLANTFDALEDLAEVRKYISNLWSEFVNPESSAPRNDPGVLAVVTKTAVEFGRSIAEDAMPAFQKHGRVDWTRVLRRSLPCYYLTETTLLTLSLVLWRGNTSIYSEGSFGVRELEIPWKSKTVEHKLTDHRVITTELWFEALALVHHVPDYPCTDEFIRGVKEFKETKKVPFSLVFAAQVNLGIHQVVGSYAESSVNTLLNRIDSMNQDLKSHINFQQGIKDPHWSPRDGKWLKDTKEGFDWFLDDPLRKVKTMVNDNNYTRQEGWLHLARAKKWRILRRSPVIAGLALYYHRAEMHEAGLKVTNAWGSLILPGHLYNALRKEECAKGTWLDMQTLFNMLGEEQFFVGGRPDKVSDYAKRFMLQIGVSAAAFTNNRRRGTKWSLKISRVLVHDFSQRVPQFIKVSRTESEGKGKSQRTVPPAEQEIRISPVGVLSSLVMAMKGEVNELAFGYLPMHRMSWKILRATRARCEPYLKEIYGPDFTIKEWELPFIIGHILPLAHDESMDMLRAAGLRRIYELSGIDYGITSGQNQFLQSFTNPQGSLVDDGLDPESEEESDDENFFVTRHTVSLTTGQVTTHRERIPLTPSVNQQLGE